MSHPALFRAARAGTLGHVRSADRDPAPHYFEGEVLTSHLVGFSEKYHFAEKSKREEGGGKSDSKDSKDSDSKKKDPIHKKGSDAVRRSALHCPERSLIACDRAGRRRQEE